MIVIKKKNVYENETNLLEGKKNRKQEWENTRLSEGKGDRKLRLASHLQIRDRGGGLVAGKRFLPEGPRGGEKVEKRSWGGGGLFVNTKNKQVGLNEEK